MSEFEKAVRKALIDREWSTSDLAKELGISLGYLYEILNGTRKAEEQKKKMCELLGIQL